MSILIDEGQFPAGLGVEIPSDIEQVLSLHAPVARIRRGHELRLVLMAVDGPPSTATARDDKLIALLSEAQKERVTFSQRRDRH